METKRNKLPIMRNLKNRKIPFGIKNLNCNKNIIINTVIN